MEGVTLQKDPAPWPGPGFDPSDVGRTFLGPKADSSACRGGAGGCFFGGGGSKGVVGGATIGRRLPSCHLFNNTDKSVPTHFCLPTHLFGHSQRMGCTVPPLYIRVG